MNDELTPTPDGKFEFRIRVSGARPRIKLHCTRQADALQRKVRLVRIRDVYVGKEMAAEALVVLKKLGEATTEGVFTRLETEALKIADAGKQEPVRNAGVRTMDDLARAWFSGELHAQYRVQVEQLEPEMREKYTSRWKKFSSEIGRIEVRKFTLDDANRALAALPVELERGTLINYQSMLRRMLNLAVLVQIIDRSPIPRGWVMTRGKAPAMSYLYPQEDAKLMAARLVPFENRLFYGLCDRESFRLEEALGLRWRHFDLELGVVRLEDNKTDDHGRAWPLSKGCVRALLHWAAIAKEQGHGAPDDLVFRLNFGKDAAGIFRRHLQTAGVTRPELFERSKGVRIPIRLHDLRATFITLNLALGRPEKWIMNRTGHTTSAMLQRYARSADNLRELFHWGEDDSAKPTEPLLPLDVALGLDQGPSSAPNGSPTGNGPKVDQGTDQKEGTSMNLAGPGSLHQTPRTLPSTPEAAKNAGLASPRRTNGSDGPHPTSVVDQGPENSRGPVGGLLADPDQALCEALTAATSAGQWRAVELIVTELRERRLAREGAAGVVSLDQARAQRRSGG